jgi:hypothetical protein
MANEHKILSVVAVIEAILNLGLSILLIHYLPSFLESMGIFISDSAIIGVALGTFIPNLFLALFFNVPKACKFANIKLKEYFQTVISPTLRISFLSLVVSLLLYLIKYPTGLLNVGFYIIVSMLSFILFTWFLGLKSWERKQATEFIKKHIPYKR